MANTPIQRIAGMDFKADVHRGSFFSGLLDVKDAGTARHIVIAGEQ